MPYRKEDGFDYSGFYKTKKHGFTMIHRFLDKNGFVKVVIDENATVLVFNIIMDIDENSLYYKPIDYSSFITLCPNFNFRKLRELLYKAKENGFDTSNIPSELLISPKQIIKDK